MVERPDPQRSHFLQILWPLCTPCLLDGFVTFGPPLSLSCLNQYGLFTNLSCCLFSHFSPHILALWRAFIPIFFFPAVSTQGFPSQSYSLTLISTQSHYLPSWNPQDVPLRKLQPPRWGLIYLSTSCPTSTMPPTNMSTKLQSSQTGNCLKIFFFLSCSSWSYPVSPPCLA